MMEKRVVDEFARRGRTLALAESLTGGLVAARLTGVPGASKVLVGAFVTYMGRAKEDMLGVPDVVARGDAVSPRVAEAMARACRKLAGAHVAVSLTGVAGPDPQDGHPVGLVYFGVATASGVRVAERRFDPRGDREAIREQARSEALKLALEALDG